MCAVSAEMIAGLGRVVAAVYTLNINIDLLFFNMFGQEK